MKKILGLDLGTSSIGWALVNESNNQKSEIIKLGVRIIQYDTFSKVDRLGKVTESKNPIEDFTSGKGLSPNAKRTQQRGARRNLQRFKQRRKALIEILTKNGFITDAKELTEIGKDTTHQTLAIRAKAAVKKIEKEEFARVLLAINKKRGYRSSRKAKSEEEGNLIDGMAVAKELYDSNLTVGQYVFQLLENGGKYIPDFYRSDLQNEFDKIWEFQRQFYTDILTDELYNELKGKNKGATYKICEEPFQITGNVKQEGTAFEKKKERYLWRGEAISRQFDLEYLVIVLQEINNNLNNSSGYLGAISDRSKELFFNKETVGENLYKQIQQNPHTSLKNQVFYRQDYLDEFEQIWEIQAKHHKGLTHELKEEIRDVIIFYQRKLKSQKHLISECEFEKHHKAIPKSSPLFQEFKIWQNLNYLELKNSETKETVMFRELDEDIRQAVFEELNLRGNLKIKEVIKLLASYRALGKLDLWKSKYKEIEGNRTNEALYNVYQKIAENEGYGFDWDKKSASEINKELTSIFPEIGIDAKILKFNSDFGGDEFDKQESYQLWHLLYSAEDDDKIAEEDKIIYGNSNVALKKKLHTKYGFKPEHANMLANVAFQADYGSLSARAIKKILPYLKAGHPFAGNAGDNQLVGACEMAGYNHSHAMTTEESEKRLLKGKLELLKKNSLRNPVVEKILNQMVNVVNQVIETYGNPDEIRIELARELKKSSDERKQMTEGINKSKTKYEEIRKHLKKDFGIKNPTRNDIIRYRLYEELRANGHKTLYTNQHIPLGKLFSKEIEIEHIIPKAKLFDDSFSNKTLAFSKPNKDKGNSTAMDFIQDKFSDDVEDYKSRVEKLYNNGKGAFSKAKRNKLLMEEKDIPDGFIERDLRDSQYIAKKAKQMLEKVVRTVNTTTGSITSKLREDWDLINVMQELSLPKFKAIDENLIEKIERKDGTFKTRIKDWSKRSDHRHHAMDALTVAFTTYDHVQYLNNLNTVRQLDGTAVAHEKSKLYGIKNKVTKVYEYKNGRKRKFIPPMTNFREEAKKHIENILISFKARNKVVTRNINKTKIKGKDKYNTKMQLTPRGQLHKETIYGRIKEVVVKEEKVNAKFNEVKINQITKPKYQEALLRRLQEFNGDTKKAFTGKNTLIKNPVYLDESKKESVPEIVKVQFFEDSYTIRKEISADLKVDKVIDIGVQRILQKRVDDFGENQKEAFSNLDKNPIWLNKEKGISIKRVRISGVKNAEALHTKKDHLGENILKDGAQVATDFVSTGNNHHVAIYKDEKGKLQEKVVSFYEAVARVNAGVSIINKAHNKDKGWQFLFTMKQNEMFVFSSDNFDPNEVDLEDEGNACKISKNLFRVQKIATKDYFFRHHLETTVDNMSSVKGYCWKREGLNGIKEIMKVRINHLGKIVHAGEY